MKKRSGSAWDDEQQVGPDVRLGEALEITPRHDAEVQLLRVPLGSHCGRGGQKAMLCSAPSSSTPYGVTSRKRRLARQS